MKRTIAYLLLLLSSQVCVAVAQSRQGIIGDKPDLSGTWALDNSRGNYIKFNTDVARAGITLIISHHEPELKIRRKFILDGHERTQEPIYYTDGRGETNPAMMVDQFIKSKTKWDKRKLVTKSSLKTSMRGNMIYTDAMEKWELSPDGKTLIVTTSTTTPRGDKGVFIVPSDTEDIKKVFKRIS
jgi:hypothetical protein